MKFRFSLPPHKPAVDFLYYLKQRCQNHGLQITAGHLAYVTLLSLVPLISVAVAIFSAFPGFADTRAKLEQFIFENFIPTAGDVVQQYMGQFVENASKMTAVGILSLAVIALLLISNIDKSINRIFEIRTHRRGVFSFSLYWMILTMGPLLIGASLAATTYVTSLKLFSDPNVSGLSTFLVGRLPFVLSVMAFGFLYLLVPNTRVRFRDAVIGAVVAAVLFETSKKLFAWYVTSFPSYEAIYGALAVVPILFVWIYLSWMIVLFGATVTAALPEFFNGDTAPAKITDNVDELTGQPAVTPK
ncbi:MAG: virulence factor BrkB family protein [Ferrimonas sp.]